MKNPVVLHVVRPFADEREYLAAEAWTIDDRGMFLLVNDELAPDTAVVFDVALANGQKVIRAEGRVERFVPAQGNHPSGLRVRFRRFGAQTKSFIDRAIAHTERRSAAPLTQRSVTMAEPAPASSGPRSLPPPLPSSRAPRLASERGQAPERAPESQRGGALTSRPPPLPRRNLTPPAGMPLPLAPSLAPERAPASNRPRVRAEAEPILPGTVPASRKTMPGLGDETLEPPLAKEPPRAPEPADPAIPSALAGEPVPGSRPADSESSGVHSVTGGSLALPQNRDELLKRLRERARSPESERRDASAVGRSEG